MSSLTIRKPALHKKWSFPLRISSVDVTISTGNCRFGYVYWRNPSWKTSYFVQCWCSRYICSADIMNLSIKLSTFPEECKIAKLKPIFKKGARTDPKNYRPISLLPLVSKIVEKSIHFQINKKKLIYMYQWGSRKNHSTDFCVAQLTDFILTGMDKQMHPSMILVDLQKAFNTLDQRVLLEKMKDFGFRTSGIKWFESYLSNRKFLVCIDYVFSVAGTLKYGAPQSPILGPLLFLLYVNDLPQSWSDAGSFCMQMTPVFSTNMRTLKKLKMF